MPDFDVTFKFEKTFRIEGVKNKVKAQEDGIDKVSFFLSDCQADVSELMNIEVHHVEA